MREAIASSSATVAASIAEQSVLGGGESLTQHAIESVNNRSTPLESGVQDGSIPVGALPAKIADDSDPTPFTQSQMWRLRKGPRLGAEWLVKEGTKDKLLVEQYRQECSVLYKAGEARHPRPEVNQVWTGFAVMVGDIPSVIAKLAKNGWKLDVQPKHQLALLAGGVQ